MASSQRSFNYTDRERILRSAVQIRLVDGKPPSFEATIKLPPDTFDATDRVFIEAESGRWSARFPWGTVSSLQAPEDRALRGFPGLGLQFRLKVVRPSGALVASLAGTADGIRASEADGTRQAILPVLPFNLGEEMWQLYFGEQGPCLRVNDQFPNVLHYVRNDSSFFSLVFPGVLRTVLTRLALEEKISPSEDHCQLWRDDWLAFGKQLAGEEIPEAVEDAETEALTEASRADREGWLNNVVRAFCQQHQIRKRLEEALAEEEQQ